ncbi:hypothetical protein EJB05_22379 [Eragrostis curvula]|uniref:HMA domain-containing protein n=1 Tax=Eragrostis curvula TaxID=38414 RepID=A0A5J9V3G1_9POAL|nr:hypothetical protein EJB05_22379 [Eragrostis curvula]
MGEEAAEKKEEKPAEAQEIVLKVDMHCEGCAKKVEKSLLRFEGVENVKADSRSRTVVVKSWTADPAKVCERVQKKTKRRVELISPLPAPPEEKREEAPPPPPPEETKDEPPKPITVILKVQMHCELCAQLLQERISKIEGVFLTNSLPDAAWCVESAVADLLNGQMTVKGVMDPAVLADSIQRKTRRPAAIAEEEKKPEDEYKSEEGENKADEEIKRYELGPPVQNYVEYVYPYAPPLTPFLEEFGDEDPNACAIV